VGATASQGGGVLLASCSEGEHHSSSYVKLWKKVRLAWVGHVGSMNQAMLIFISLEQSWVKLYFYFGRWNNVGQHGNVSCFLSTAVNPFGGL
jgi:hypothetical protein